MPVRILIASISVLCASIALPQTGRYRGAPDPLTVEDLVGPDPRGHDRGVVIAPVLYPVVAAQDGNVPEGIEPLPVDIFTTTDFYVDTEFWSDPRYFRCNSPAMLEAQWGATEVPIIGDDPPRTAAWGFCDRDYPRDEMVSPYPFDSAKAHYEALEAEAQSSGGPTIYTQATLPDWNGRYERRRQKVQSWLYGNILQIPTFLSLLTDEYQRRYVQQAYHAAHNSPQWPASYCWPEGYMRRISQYGGGATQFILAPQLVLELRFTSQRMATQIHIGREFIEEDGIPRLGPAVPQWYGETIGFWDGEALITWTSNIKSWISHGIHEYSNRLQSIEIYTPLRGESGVLTGLKHEIVLYDDEAFVEPVRVVQWLDRVGELGDGDPFPTDECIAANFPVNGETTPVAPGRMVEYIVPDIYGRPWAAIWERYHEEGMTPPVADTDIFDFGP